jgi:preprotein translocase subunit SecG
MFSILMALEVIISILLVVVVLMQSSKGGGLAGTFGGGNVGAVFGVRRTADFLTQATVVLASAMGILALVINLFFLPRPYGEGAESVLQQGVPAQQQAAPPPQLPPAQLPTEAPSGGGAPQQ